MHRVSTVSQLSDGQMKREVVGFFADELSAVIAVSDNAGGLQNDLLVIEEIPFGFNQTPVSAQWFKRDVEGDYYYPVENPDQR